MSDIDDDKQQRWVELEHLAKLADDRWREYDSKSQAEWKLSYGVWDTSGRVSMWVQLAITSLLGLLLAGTAYLVSR